MSKKSRMFLALAALAMLVSLAARFLPVDATHRVGDFAIGCGAALMVGVLITWKRDRSPQS